MALTEKKRRVISEFLSDPQAGRIAAVIRGGYSEERATVTASELFNDAEFMAELQRRTEKKLRDTEVVKVTCNDVQKELLDVIETCKQSGAGAWQMTARLKAAELLGKYIKMFTDRVEFGVDDLIREKLLEGRKRAGIQTPEEIKVEIVRAQLPPTIDGDGGNLVN